MTLTRRKIVYAISFETIGAGVASAYLWLVSDSGPATSLALAILTATKALVWSFVFNSFFEAWETRYPIKGRSLRRRSVHAILFEGGVVLICMPVMAWWLGVSLGKAALYEAGLILVSILFRMHSPGLSTISSACPLRRAKGLR